MNVRSTYLRVRSHAVWGPVVRFLADNSVILAFVAILVWHMYTAHLDPDVFPMSGVWLNGRMTGAELRRFHVLEYRRLLESRERLYREILALDQDKPGAGPAA